MKIGDKVVCIGIGRDPTSDEIAHGAYNDSNFIHEGNPIRVNKIYVIRGFFIDSFNVLNLKFVGSYVYWKRSYPLIEIGYFAEAFRKLDEIKMENELKYYKEQLIHK